MKRIVIVIDVPDYTDETYVLDTLQEDGIGDLEIPDPIIYASVDAFIADPPGGEASA